MATQPRRPQPKAVSRHHTTSPDITGRHSRSPDARGRAAKSRPLGLALLQHAARGPPGRLPHLAHRELLAKLPDRLDALP